MPSVLSLTIQEFPHSLDPKETVELLQSCRLSLA